MFVMLNNLNIKQLWQEVVVVWALLAESLQVQQLKELVMKKEESILVSKLLLIFIKYIPIIQMLIMILNNILSYLDIDNKVLYLFDFTTGNSLLFTMLMYLLSIKLGYCKWHRYLITGNLINLFVVILDSIYFLPVDDIFILLFYCTVGCISIISATYSHVKDIKHETRLKINKASPCGND